MVLVDGGHGEKEGAAAESPVDYRGNPVDKSRTGGWLAAGLILGTELSERVCVMGISMNLVTYLVGDLHLSSSKSANVVTNFMGTLNILGLLGGFLADAKLGRYLTVAIFASVAALGVTLLTLATSIPSMVPPRCDPRKSHECIEASGRQLALLFIALYTIALGGGGIKSNVSGFGSDQFDASNPKENKAMIYFFNRFYFCISLGSLFAVTVLVYIQDNVGRGWAVYIHTNLTVRSNLANPFCSLSISIPRFLRSESMAEEKKWVLMVTAQTPTNIAVIKYWGKRDETLILPINDSISVTLDPAHLCTTTTVAVSPAFQQDRMWLNGKEIPLSGGRYQNCLREIRARACDVEDEKKGIKISKKDWENLHLHIASYNNFPTAAGLASSAAGFACLVFALGKLMNVKEDNSQLSAIARQGSGSACRSLFGGFVKWNMGKDENGSDSLAVQLVDEKHWDELVIIIAVVSSRQKETSSTSGMRETVETSPLIQHRAKEVVPKRVIQMEEAIKNRDFPTFAHLSCADSNQFHAVCLDTSPPIFYMNDTSHRIISCVEKWNRSEGTPQVAYTFDAGPNAVMIARNRKAATLLLQRLLFHFPPNSDTDLSSYVIGDNSILEDAGIKDLKDIEALPPPPEVKDNVPAKNKGDVSYFICTRPGRGPVLITDENQALLDPETGLPK